MVTNRDYESPPHGQLIQQRSGNAGGRGGHDYGIKGSFFGPTQGAVADLDLDVKITERFQNAPGPGSQSM